MEVGTFFLLDGVFWSVLLSHEEGVKKKKKEKEKDNQK